LTFFFIAVKPHLSSLTITRPISSRSAPFHLPCDLDFNSFLSISLQHHNLFPKSEWHSATISTTMQAMPDSRQQSFEEIYGPPENFLEIEVCPPGHARK
jgi:hypothetical protein